MKNYEPLKNDEATIVHSEPAVRKDDGTKWTLWTIISRSPEAVQHRINDIMDGIENGAAEFNTPKLMPDGNWCAIGKTVYVPISEPHPDPDKASEHRP